MWRPFQLQLCLGGSPHRNSERQPVCRKTRSISNQIKAKISKRGKLGCARGLFSIDVF